ncbi:hypothetical protein G9A89_010319 [Geosiphon pyriformis]|nr:hypothetical protein G9A89_010319 [Geosiphon pyriformis]
MTTTRAKSKKAVPDICPEISNKISTRRALSVVKATRQNVLKAFLLPSNCDKLPLVVAKVTFLSLTGFSPVKVSSKRHTWVSPSVASTPTKSPKVFNNRPVNKLVFPSIASTSGAASTSSKKMQSLASAIVTPNSFVVPNEILDEISIVLSSTSSKMGQDQPLAVLPNVMSSGRSLLVLEAKQSSSVGLPVLGNWADQMETNSSSLLVSGATSGGAWETITSHQRFAGWVASTLVSGTTFKIKLAYVKTVFQSVHSFLNAKSVLKDNVKLFCVEFASQQSLEAVFLVELTSSVCLTTFKIAKSLVVSESGSFPAAVVLHDVSLGVSAIDVKLAFSVFGSVTCVVLKPAGVWQYVMVHFEKLDSAVSALKYWSVLIGKDSIRILSLVNQNKTILFRDKFKAKLVNLFPGCTTFEISNMISQIGSQTCFIPLKNNFKVATTPDTTTLEYYQSIYTHCKQKFNILDGIEIVKKSVYQYIENCINNYLFGNYNISEVRSNLYNNLAHYSQLETEDLNSKTLATYFHKLNFNIIKYCEETYPVQSQYTIDFESETKTNNKGKNKLKQYSRTTPNTPTLLKTTANHLQTPEQGTTQMPNSPLNQFARPEDFTALKTENQSEHSETTANEENNSEITEEESIDNEKEEDKMTTYIAKIPEFNGEDIETSPQEWLDQVTKAGDANGWNAARMLRTILYFLKGTAGEWFENLAAPFNDWNAFKAAFLKQFTDNNTSITLRNCFRNIKQEPSEFIMTYIGKFNKLLKQIRQLETNNYYSDAQILDQFIAGLKDKLIKKVRPHAPEDLNSAIQYVKRYKMAMEEANCTKLVNLAIGKTSSTAEKKIDQLTKKVENYFTNQQQQQPQRYQPPQRRNQNNFAPLSNNQP